MLRPGGIDKTTKCCGLTVYLLTGVRIEGIYHIATSTSSAVRPSDALRDSKEGFIVLTNATVYENGSTREQGSILIRVEAISHVDLPAKGWTARDGAPPGITPAPAMARL